MAIVEPKFVMTKDALLQLVEENTPYLHSYYSNSADVRNDFENHYFDHYLLESTRKEIIQVPFESGTSLALQVEQHFHETFNFVLNLFKTKPNPWLVGRYRTNCISDADLELLIKLARDELARGLSVRDSLLVRYDCAADVDAGTLDGVFEINADTPTMLFESILLQNAIASKERDSESQSNEFFTMAQAGMLPVKNKLVAVVCNTSYTEDLSTTELVAQLLECGNNTVLFADVTQFNHDILSMVKPFFVDGVDQPVDAAYILIPWEELVTSGRDILIHRDKFNFHFMQPAFMWFVGHKMTQALMTAEINDGHMDNVPGHIPTYTNASYFIDNNIDYVAKPVIGRFSQNIEFHVAGQDTKTDGVYGEEVMVYQQYVKPTEVDGKNYIFCPWLMQDEVSGFSFRRFNGLVNDEKEEFFIPHVLV